MANVLGNNPPQQQMQVDLSSSKPMVCKNCGHDVFISGVKIRTISKILTGTAQDAILPIDVFLCGDCGEINQDLLPPQIRELESKEKGSSNASLTL